MVGQNNNQKIAAYSLVALVILIGAFHYWQGITISQPASGDRLFGSLYIIGCACLIPYGYRFARVTVGATFLFFAFINSLIILAYVRDLSFNSLQILLITTSLTFVGYTMLKWKGIRVFEHKRGERLLVNS